MDIQSPIPLIRAGYVRRNYLVPVQHLKRFTEIFDHPPGPSAAEVKAETAKHERWNHQMDAMRISGLVAIVCFGISVWIHHLDGEIRVSWLNALACVFAVGACTGLMFAARTFISWK